eukprot:comp20925_c0_seq1/m.27928 comp20925_c0_seq1/g.27928  ORF comp20925_c0_seq1/g.27928 comp20925_c0_seq1/m.27928 type:complete len:564 (-) comp20925_c0_seq1:43-1734(-)
MADKLKPRMPVEGKVPKVLLIDNYDSFTFNVYQYLRELGADVHVHRNDKITLEECWALKPTHVVISPGPGHPSTDAGISRPVIQDFAGKIPVFGVCMGQQCMYEVFGGTVKSAGEILHGKVSEILHDAKGIFANIPQNIKVTRYHSLAGDGSKVPDALEVTAKTHGGIVMAVRHKKYVVEGVQFHPESILSEHGHDMFRNFLAYSAGTWEEMDAPRRYSHSDTRQALQVAIRMLCDREEPTGAQLKEAFDEVMDGRATDAQLSAFLMAIKLHGETPTIVDAVCRAVLERSEPCGVEDVVDIVGTGGDGQDTFNVSTTSAIVAAGAGLRVAKHGNRSASSQCGSADVLEHLGGVISLPPSACADIVKGAGFCFLFAQAFHPTMKILAPVRRQMGVRTVFNMIGPLINPARPRAMVVGVYSPLIGRLMAETLLLRGLTEALVVCGHEGLDEVSICGPSYVWRLHKGQITEGKLTPEDFGLPTHTIDQVRGGPPAYNAGELMALLDGKEGPNLDFVLINSAALLVAGGKAKTYKEGVELARESIGSGRARQVLTQYIALSRAAAGK